MFWITIAITVLFFFSLLLKRKFQDLCAICSAVMLVWVIGLFFGFNPLILGILMGGSAIGFMYYLGSKWPEKFNVFKLPYLLTAFTLIYFVLVKEFDAASMLALAGVWLLFGALFIFRNGGAAGWFEKVVGCCKNW